MSIKMLCKTRTDVLGKEEQYFPFLLKSAIRIEAQYPAQAWELIQNLMHLEKEQRSEESRYRLNPSVYWFEKCWKEKKDSFLRLMWNQFKKDYPLNSGSSWKSSSISIPELEVLNRWLKVVVWIQNEGKEISPYQKRWIEEVAGYTKIQFEGRQVYSWNSEVWINASLLWACLGRWDVVEVFNDKVAQSIPYVEPSSGLKVKKDRNENWMSVGEANRRFKMESQETIRWMNQLWLQGDGKSRFHTLFSKEYSNGVNPISKMLLVPCHRPEHEAIRNEWILNWISRGYNPGVWGALEWLEETQPLQSWMKVDQGLKNQNLQQAYQTVMKVRWSERWAKSDPKGGHKPSKWFWPEASRAVFLLDERMKQTLKTGGKISRKEWTEMKRVRDRLVKHLGRTLSDRREDLRWANLVDFQTQVKGLKSVSMEDLYWISKSKEDWEDLKNDLKEFHAWLKYYEKIKDKTIMIGCNVSSWIKEADLPLEIDWKKYQEPESLTKNNQMTAGFITLKESESKFDEAWEPQERLTVESESFIKVPLLWLLFKPRKKESGEWMRLSDHFSKDQKEIWMEMMGTSVESVEKTIFNEMQTSIEGYHHEAMKESGRWNDRFRESTPIGPPLKHLQSWLNRTEQDALHWDGVLSSMKRIMNGILKEEDPEISIQVKAKRKNQ